MDEVIRIQVKPRGEMNEEHTRVNIEGENKNESPKPSRDETQPKQNLFDPSRESNDFHSYFCTPPPGAFEFKILRREIDLDSLKDEPAEPTRSGGQANIPSTVTTVKKVASPGMTRVDILPYQGNADAPIETIIDAIPDNEDEPEPTGSGRQANIPSPVTTMRKVASPENTTVDKILPNQGNAITEVENIVMIAAIADDDEDERKRIRDVDKEMPDTINSFVQVELGHLDGGQNDSQTPSLKCINRSEVDGRATNTSSMTCPGIVRAKRKLWHFKRRGKPVAPCDDAPSKTKQNDEQHCNNDDSGSNSSVTIDISEGDSGVGTQSEDNRQSSPLDDVAVEGDTNRKTYFHYLFDIFFWLGLSPRRIDKVGWILNWIPFVILSATAIMHDIFVIKDEYIWTKDDILRCVGMGFHIVGLLLRSSFVHLIIRFKHIKELVRLLSSVSQELPKSKIIAAVAVSVLTSIVMAILYSIAITAAVYHGLEYDIEDLLAWRAYRLSEDLFLWSKENAENHSALIAQEFEGNVTNSKEISMGIAGFFIQITGHLYGIIIRDISIVAAFSVFGLTTVFLSILDFDKKPTEEECEQIWKFYKSLQKISNQTEKAFGIFFQILHVDNIFFCSLIFCDHLVRGEIYVTLIRVCLFSKVIYFYIIAAMVYGVNAVFRRWILKTFPGPNTLFKEGSEYITTSNVLEQIKMDRIAIGSSFLYIDYSFLWKFATYVGSVFFFFAQHNE